MPTEPLPIVIDASLAIRATLMLCVQWGIPMANLTLSIDDELLQKAREAAVREKTSVNALVREYLERYVDARERRVHALDALDALAERTDSASSQRWSRESLYEGEAP